MLTIDIDEFSLELQDGTLKHVGASNKSATTKLYEVTETEVREFGDERIKLVCRDDGGNEIEVALDPTEASTVAHEISQLEEESRVFE